MLPHGPSSSNDQPRGNPRNSDQQHPVKVVAEKYSYSPNRSRAQVDHQRGKGSKSNETSEKNREQKMANTHFRDRRCQDKSLEGRRRRQHRRKHQAPEGMFFKSIVQFCKASRRDPLAQ